MSWKKQRSGDGVDRRRGITLLFSIAILALLALFSVVFARLMNLERRASAYYTDRVRAKLAARAGIERAIVELQKIAGKKHFSDPWGDGWGYRLTKPANLDKEQRPLDLQTTTEPSFSETDPQGRKRLGETITYSGNLGVPYKGSLLLYRLKILDATSQVNLNHRDGHAARRMLKALLKVDLGLADGTAQKVVNKVILDDQIEAPKRFRSKPQIGEAIEVALQSEAGRTQQQAKDEYLYKIRDNITIHSWEDPTVVRPWALNIGATPAQTKQQKLVLMPRAPINVNTASRSVLIALFAEASAQTRYGTFTISFTAAGKLADAIITARGTPKSGTSGGFTPFKSWRQFEQFVDTLPNGTFTGPPAQIGGLRVNPTAWPTNTKWLPDAGTTGVYQRAQTQHYVAHRDLVKAVCNPNTMVNKFGQMSNHGGWKGYLPRMVDKTDLVQMTTEACFDSMGVFEITSAGMILLEDEKDSDTGYEILASHTDQMVVRVYNPYRLTTQHDFEKHRAYMVSGNFIDAPEKVTPKTFTINDAFKASVNQVSYFAGGSDYNSNAMPVPGWPGVVSWPQYSLDRVATLDYSPKAQYPMASWDGHLTLSNMITVRTGDPDFVAGFSRGKVDAFKARAWWEPRDREPSGQVKNTVPTRPKDAAELKALATPMGGDPPSVTGNPNTSTVRVRSQVNTAEASILGENFSDGSSSAPPTDPTEIWTKGSQLLNTGVLIAPDRVRPNGQPHMMAFDSNNLDLVRGTSIRFWVQPLRDPYAEDEEVLLSFVGSKGGNTRTAGFRVVKQVLGTRVYITLEAIGWASQLTGLANKRIDVTPWIMTSAGATPPVPDPRKPQWVPGTWHWVVLNIGPGTYQGRRASFATIQVDKAKSAPIAFKGDAWGVSNPPREYGEVNMYEDLGGSYIGVVSAYNQSSARIRQMIHPRHLGDWYHCQRDKPQSKANAGGLNQGANHGPGTISVAKERIFAKPEDGGPAIRWSGGAWPTFPFVGRGVSVPGRYITTGNFPTDPFPILSYNHRMAIRFYKNDGSGALSGTPDLAMVRNGDLWTAPWPKRTNRVYGPDPTYTFWAGRRWGYVTNDKGYPGNLEWHMAIVTNWEEAHYLASSEWGNTEPGWAKLSVGGVPTWLPADLSKLYAVDEPFQSGDTIPGDYATNGENLPYSVHNSGRTTKGGQPGPLSADPRQFKRSYVRTKQSIKGIPLQYIDDDCHGCEDCDLDGPVFIGCEPNGGTNGTAGALAAPDKDTMSYAIFDNVVFINNDPTRRTDAQNPALTAPELFEKPPNPNDPTAPLPPVNLEFKDFEDRFFEEDLAQYLVSRGDPKGTGAVYHRGLLELRNTQVRLGSMTWTSYPTQGGLDYELGLWKVINIIDTTANTQTYNYTTKVVPDGKLDAPDFGGFRDDPSAGISFAAPNDPPTGFAGTQAFLDGLGEVQGNLIRQELLVLGIRLKEHDQNRRVIDNPDTSAGVIISPIVQTPIFEDVTINLITARPVIVYAEEGAIE